MLYLRGGREGGSGDMSEAEEIELLLQQIEELTMGLGAERTARESAEWAAIKSVAEKLVRQNPFSRCFHAPPTHRCRHYTCIQARVLSKEHIRSIMPYRTREIPCLRRPISITVVSQTASLLGTSYGRSLTTYRISEVA